MKITNKDILKLGAFLFALVFVVIMMIFAFTKPNENTEVDPPQVTYEPPAVLVKPDRTPAEEQNVIDNIIGDAISGNIGNYSDVNKLLPSEKQELEEDSYNVYYKEILRYLSGRNFDAISTLCYNISSTYHITNEDYANVIYGFSDIRNFESWDYWDRMELLGTTTDPQLYVALFCLMSTQEQGSVLPKLNITALPDSSQTNFTITNVSEGGTFYSDAYRHFSDFTNTVVEKYTVEYDNGSSYEIYYAYNNNVGKRLITNITTSDINDISSTYQDYFDLNELEVFLPWVD